MQPKLPIMLRRETVFLPQKFVVSCITIIACTKMVIVEAVTPESLTHQLSHKVLDSVESTENKERQSRSAVIEDICSTLRITQLMRNHGICNANCTMNVNPGLTLESWNGPLDTGQMCENHLDTGQMSDSHHLDFRLRNVQQIIRFCNFDDKFDGLFSICNNQLNRTEFEDIESETRLLYWYLYLTASFVMILVYIVMEESNILNINVFGEKGKIVTTPEDTNCAERCYRNKSDIDCHVRQCKATEVSCTSPAREVVHIERSEKSYCDEKCKGNDEDDSSERQPIYRLHVVEKDDGTDYLRCPKQPSLRPCTEKEKSKPGLWSLENASYQTHLHGTDHRPRQDDIQTGSYNTSHRRALSRLCDSKKHRYGRKISLRTFRNRKMIKRKVSSDHSANGSWDFEKIKKVLFPLDFLSQQSGFQRVYVLERSYESPFMRLYSFRSWPLDSLVPATRLADHGFACTNPDNQTVECVECGYEVNVSELRDQDVLRAHQDHSPECSFSNPNSGQQPNELSDQQSNQQVQEDGASVVQEDGSFNAQRPSNMPFQHLSRTDSFAASGLRTSVTLSSVSSTNNQVGSETGARVYQAVSRTNEPAHSYGESENRHNTSSQSPQSSVRQSVPESITAAPAYVVRNPQYTLYETRRSSFLYWPHQGELDIDLIADAGFFFTGSEDIVRCYHCDIGLAEWNPDDDPWLEHARHSPDCPYLRQKKGQSYIDGVQREWSQVYQPKHPEYSQMEDRMRSFNGGNWPRDQVQQTPQELAAAGFYFTGDGDTCRCHYCDGGLREWESEDDPWVEHARWFPFCKYVLKVKGAPFIQRCATGNPSSNTDNGRAATATLPANFSNQPMQISYVDECRRKEQRNPMLSAAALSVRAMGYSRRTIYLAINTYIQNTGRRDFKARDLMDIVFEREENGESLEDDEDFSRHVPDNAPASYAVAGGNDSDEEMELTPEALQKEHEHLLKKMKCFVCSERDRCIVYVPCGHRLVCEQCAEKTEKCNHCGVRIDRRVKTFLS